MADFLATTVCNPAVITDIEAVGQIIDKYEFEAGDACLGFILRISLNL